MDKRTTPWRRLLIDGLTIVFSILAAFAIDAWWDTHLEERRFDEVFERLDYGLEASMEQIDRLVVRASRDTDRIRTFLVGSVADAAEVPYDSTFRLLEALSRPLTGDNNTTYLGRVLDDSGLRSFDDAKLASEIAMWRVVVAELGERDALLASLEVEMLKIMNRHPEVARLYAGFRLDQNGAAQLDVDASGLSKQAMAQLRRDEGLVALGATKVAAREQQLLALEQLRQATRPLLSSVKFHRSL